MFLAALPPKTYPFLWFQGYALEVAVALHDDLVGHRSKLQLAPAYYSNLRLGVT